MASTYKHNYVAFRTELLKAAFMQVEMKSRADRMKDYAESIAPVDKQSRHPGRYKASFHSDVTTAHSNRAIGRTWNDSPEAGFVEYGTKNNPARHVLTRAMDAGR